MMYYSKLLAAFIQLDFWKTVKKYYFEIIQLFQCL